MSDQNKELLGDKTEQILKKFGVDKVVKRLEKVTRRPCNCNKRKNMLNKLHQSYLNKKR